MKIERLKFQQSAAQRVYDDYMKRMQKTTKTLSKSDQEDVLMEFNSHIFEGMQNQSKDSEIDTLLDILDRLGTPEVVLKPMIADKKIEQATKTFNPIHIFKALVLNITNGISYIIFLFLYLLLLGFLYLIYAKLRYPSEVGMFFNDDSFMALGRVSAEKLQSSGMTEVLGYGFIPVMILSILVFYFLITLLLRLKRSLNKK